MFENKHKVCVWGVVLADSPKVFPLPKMKPLPVLLKELSCVHLEITIVLTITANV